MSRIASWPFRSWIVAAAVVVGCGGAVSTAYNTHETAVTARHAAARANETARQVREAICTLRGERVASIAQLRGNITRAEDFLRRHPNGSGDISRADIQASIDSIRSQIRLQQGTIRAFRNVACR